MSIGACITVADLIEKLSSLPGHIPVHIEMPCADAAGTVYFYALDCELHSFPTQGLMAVIVPNMNPR